MTTAQYLATVAIPSALKLLPAEMDTHEARAMLLAIAYQESGCLHRRQRGGPARGFYQFEVGGVRGVLLHPASKPHIADVLALLAYPVIADATTPYMAIEHSDVLATVFARLLLWTDPEPLPTRDQAESGWAVYQRCWRPGAPRPEAWPQNFRAGWALVDAAETV